MGSLMGALELSALRDAAEGLMDGSVVVWRGTLAADGVGGQTRGTLAVGTFPCRAVPRRGEPSESVQGGRVEARQDWYLYVPQGSDVRVTDRLVLAGGGTFEVIGVHAGRAYEPSRRVIATERR